VNKIVNGVQVEMTEVEVAEFEISRAGVKPSVDPKAEAIKELADLKAEAEGKPLTMAYLDKRLASIEKILGL